MVKALFFIFIRIFRKTARMKIALIGYGKMGREIETIAKERHHEVALIIDQDNLADLTAEKLAAVDVAIEFTSPKSAYQNVVSCLNAGKPIVSGSTGWVEHFPDAAALCKQLGGTLFYSSNYSLGVNIFFRVNQLLASLMGKAQGYSVAVEEIHHTQKLDAPSGTAITLTELISKELPGMDGWVLAPQKAENKISITSHREGSVPGTHSVVYASDVDEITFTHAAKSRKGLALGAILAAEFVIDKKGVFGMTDLLKL